MPLERGISTMNSVPVPCLGNGKSLLSMGLKVREVHPTGIRGRMSELSAKRIVTHNGGKYTSAQAPLKGNKGVEGTGTSDCKHIHTQGTGRHSLALISSHETGRTPSSHTLNHLQCPHQQQSPLPSASTMAANEQCTQLRDALQMEGGTHLAPVCFMDMEEAKAQRVL